MGGMGGMMMQPPPVMVIAEDYIYVIYMGQLLQISKDTMEITKTVPLPMPARPMGPAGPGGPPAGAPAGPPPAAPG